MNTNANDTPTKPQMAANGRTHYTKSYISMKRLLQYALEGVNCRLRRDAETMSQAKLDELHRVKKELHWRLANPPPKKAYDE